MVGVVSLTPFSDAFRAHLECEDLYPEEPPLKKRRVSEISEAMEIEETNAIATDLSTLTLACDPWVEYEKARLLLSILVRRVHGFLPFAPFERIPERAEHLILKFATDALKIPGITAHQIDAVTSAVRTRIQNTTEALTHVNPLLAQRLVAPNCAIIGESFFLIFYIKGIEQLCKDERNIEFIRSLALSWVDIRSYLQQLIKYPSHDHLPLLQSLRNILILNGDMDENEIRRCFPDCPEKQSFVLDFLYTIRELRNERDSLFETSHCAALFLKNTAFTNKTPLSCLKQFAYDLSVGNLTLSLAEPAFCEAFFSLLKYFSLFEIPYTSDMLNLYACVLQSLFTELKQTFFELPPQNVDFVLSSVLPLGVDLEKTFNTLRFLNEQEKSTVKNLFTQNGYPKNSVPVIQFLMLDANIEMYQILQEHNLFKRQAFFYCSEATFNKLKFCFLPQDWEKLTALIDRFCGESCSIYELDDFV